jgi:5-formyltetrahydrofolate cyclo-ligase
VATDDEGASAQVKRELRARLLAARADRHAAAGDRGWRLAADRLATAALAVPEVQRSCADGAPVAAYASFGDEPPTAALLDALVAAGSPVLLPVVMPDRELAWASYAGGGSLVADRFGIPTPTGDPLGVGAQALQNAGVRVLLVPATAVTPDGIRLGQGGGFYDALLADLPTAAEGGPLRLAVVFADEVLDHLPAEPHDAGIDRAVVVRLG